MHLIKVHKKNPIVVLNMENLKRVVTLDPSNRCCRIGSQTSHLGLRIVTFGLAVIRLSLSIGKNPHINFTDLSRSPSQGPLKFFSSNEVSQSLERT